MRWHKEPQLQEASSLTVRWMFARFPIINCNKYAYENDNRKTNQQSTNYTLRLSNAQGPAVQSPIKLILD